MMSDDTVNDSLAGDTGFDANEQTGFKPRGQYGDGAEKPKVGAMEVAVSHNVEKAIKILKRKLIKEGLFKELKSRRYYEKPSEKKKRKQKESRKKVRKEEARIKKGGVLM